MWYQRPPEERQAVVRARQAEMRADASYVHQTTQPTAAAAQGPQERRRIEIDAGVVRKRIGHGRSLGR